MNVKELLVFAMVWPFLYSLTWAGTCFRSALRNDVANALSWLISVAVGVFDWVTLMNQLSNELISWTTTLYDCAKICRVALESCVLLSCLLNSFSSECRNVEMTLATWKTLPDLAIAR